MMLLFMVSCCLDIIFSVTSPINGVEVLSLLLDVVSLYVLVEIVL